MRTTWYLETHRALAVQSVLSHVTLPNAAEGLKWAAAKLAPGITVRVFTPASATGPELQAFTKLGVTLSN